MSRPDDWSLALGNKVRGLAVAREAGSCLAVEEDGRLSLLGPDGRLTARARLSAVPTAMAAADDGSTFAVALPDSQGGRAIRLDATLSPIVEVPRSATITALALDAFGVTLAVADARVNLRCYDRDGAEIRRWTAPRPLVHLAFAVGVATLVGAADFGFVGGLDLRADTWAWRDLPLNHVGGIAAAGDGSSYFAAGFRAGLQRYDKAGRKVGNAEAFPANRCVSASYDGRRVAVLALDGSVVGMTADGGPWFRWPHAPGVVANVCLSLVGDRVWGAAGGEVWCRSAPA